MYKLDTHAHTAETSPCGQVSAKDAIRLYYEAGYSGIIITDHYASYFFESSAAPCWEHAVDKYLLGYRAALETGNELGIDVLLGAELRLKNNPNDYLLFGVTEDFLYKNPELYNLTMEELRVLASENGVLIFQAHPFRPNQTRTNPLYLDGVEVVNGNPRHNSHNDLALEFANKNGLAVSAGSDFHQVEDVGRSGIVTPARISTQEELKRSLIHKAFDIIDNL